MKHSVFPGSRSGTVKIPASKSMAHRLLIAAAVAAGGCRGNVVVRGSECVNKSYPDFWRDLDGLKGAEA